MARKRKTRASEAVEEPEIVPPAEPKPELEPEPEPEPAEPVVEVEAEVKIEDAEPVETEQTVAEGEGEGEGEEEVEEEEEEEEEVEEEEAEGEEEPDNMEEEEEHVEDVPQPGGEIDEKPSENAVAENGGDGDATEGENEEGEEEFEEEDVERLLEPFSKDQLTLLIKEAIGKHPDLAEIVHKMADSDPAHCKIFVHGLGWEANTETITSVFEKYGEIEDCKVVRDKNTGKSKGYGFILFRHRSGALRALKEPQKLIEGRMTSCQLASAGPVQTPTQPAAVATVSAPPTSEYTQRKIYVSNVSAELEPKKLSEFFSKFGEIEEGPLGLDKMTGKPRGFCLFVYRSVESARKALEEPHKNFEGQILHCQKAIDGPKHSKGYFNQQHGGQSQQQPQQQHQSHHHHHHQGHQGYYNHPAKKGRYAGSAGVGHTGGHLMAPSAGPAVPSVGFNPAVAPAAIGQAVAALLATQGAGLGIGNLLGGMGGGVNPQGVPPMMNNAGYGGQGGPGGYGGQPGMQGGYGGQQQMGQGGVRPHQGGAPYMGHGH